MQNRLVVMFAYHFPPENAVGGVRPYRFYKYLSRMGYHCRVITAADQSGRTDLDCECVPDPFLTHPRNGLGWQGERALRKLLLPGVVGVRWSRLAFRAARSFLRSNRRAEVTIFSTYPPLGAHLAAFQLARSENLPWIADFRDPMADNPGHPFLKRHQHHVYRWMEQRILKTATIVIANTDAVAEKWRRASPDRHDRIHLIWNGFDPEDRVQSLPLPERDYQVITHVGALYQGRNITTLLESIARLIAVRRLAANRVRIRLVGSVLNESVPDPEFLRRAECEGWLELIPSRIAHQEALAIAQTSDGLLLVQPHSSVQVPGKLFEYLQIGRPVLAYIPRDTPIERILQRSGVPYRCVYADSPPEERDRAVEDFFTLKGQHQPANDWFESNFDVRVQTQALEKLIRSIHEGRPQPKNAAVMQTIP
jgi:glycosyltransferase involved in cell wall biosynthesis